MSLQRGHGSCQLSEGWERLGVREVSFWPLLPIPFPPCFCFLIFRYHLSVSAWPRKGAEVASLQRAFPLMLLQNGSRARCHLLLLLPFTWHTYFTQHTILFLSLVFVFVWGQELPAGKWDGSRTWAWVISHLPPQSLIVTFPLILSLCLPHASTSLSMESP